MTAPPAAVSIDVDALRLYGAIHGLGGIAPEADPIYAAALPRFFELMAELGAPATVFFIGEDVERAGPSLVRGLAETGSELASHSHTHDYRLSRQPPDRIRADLEAAHRALSAVAARAGRPAPVGFRAPGYNTSPALLAAVAALGYRYDSSLLPAPAYWAARAAALGLYTLRGRRSASLVGDLRAFAGPRAPYRTTPETPWRPDPAGPLVEVPMAVSPLTRVPIIGTSWAVLPAIARRRLLRRAIASRAPLVFEMHAIDLLDASDPGVPPELAAAQPDLRRPVREKRPLFKALFERLAGEVGLVRVCDLAAPPLTCAPAIE